ncbi:MAG TPA: glycosyltransferase [Planctomycetes bacterium]|nr:glycosyltransferase [Planctomycetota bacterium]
MTDPYSVSVITRTCNRPRMLARAIESVAAQTWEQKQLVVVNDGGESVEDIVAPYRDRMDVVLLEFSPEEKPGRCLAQVRGIEAASGSWIAYLDDDDFWFPDHLQTLMEAAKETGAKVLYTDANKAIEEPDENGNYVVTRVEPGPSEDFSRAGFYLGCYIHLSTFCHHRTVFDEHGGFDPELPVLEDLDLFYRYAFDYVFHHIKKVTAQFSVRTDYTNAITSMRREFVETNEMLAKRYLHMAVGDMMVMLVRGRDQINGLYNMVTALSSRVEELERRIADLEKNES